MDSHGEEHWEGREIETNGRLYREKELGKITGRQKEVGRFGNEGNKEGKWTGEVDFAWKGQFTQKYVTLHWTHKTN